MDETTFWYICFLGMSVIIVLAGMFPETFKEHFGSADDNGGRGFWGYLLMLALWPLMLILLIIGIVLKNAVGGCLLLGSILREAILPS
ncbi:MAG: hypothetical protein GY789_18835 [Hyphomicrobiales bacterium]|nr:hypothetical protein [Hyphomicrobiales bacterium]